MAGAKKAGLTADPKTGHMPDTYKKYSHITFSDESIFSDAEHQGGRWSTKDAAGNPVEENDRRPYGTSRLRLSIFRCTAPNSTKTRLRITLMMVFWIFPSEANPRTVRA